jgi:phenylalanyl-tRNA synthetase beta chain
MMESLKRNYTRNNDYVRLFEIGRTYLPNEDANALPKENNILTIGMYGDCDYLDLKGVVENILDALGITKISLEREKDNVCYHPGKTAALIVGKQKAGVFGEIHPDLLDNYGIDTLGYLAELNLDVLYEASNTIKAYKPLPKFPAVTRDIAILVDDEVLVGDIESTIVKAGGSLVEKVSLFDIYKGKQTPEGKKSIAYAIAYRDENKTLTDKEVNKVHDKILRSLEYKLGAQLR